MAVVVHKTADMTVADIAARNNISNKIDNMMVTVVDAIADPDVAGGGEAVYRWSGSLSKWIILSTTNYESISFKTEESLITAGAATISNVPVDNQIWDIHIIDGDNIIADLRIEDLIITSESVSGLNTWEGKKIRFTYAHGTISQQIGSYIDEKMAGTTNSGTIADFEGALI